MSQKIVKAKLRKEVVQEHVSAGKPPEIEATPLKYWKHASGLMAVEVKAFPGDGEDENANQLHAERLKEIVGVHDTELANSVLNIGSKTIQHSFTDPNHINIVLQSLHDLKPNDVIEARLGVQETALYSHAMKCLKCAEEQDSFMYAEMYLNMGVKLLRIHNETVETLSRYRRGGEQKVTVQHVVVDKAIVNNFSGVGVPTETQGTTSCHQKNAELKQEPMAIDHVSNQQWSMGAVDCMVEKVPVRELKKENSE